MVPKENRLNTLNQFTSVDSLHRTPAEQTPRSNAKSNHKQYHHCICTETTNLQPALNASPTRQHTLTVYTETIRRKQYYDLKQGDKMNLRSRLIRPNSNTASSAPFCFDKPCRHRSAHKFRPRTNILETLLESSRAGVETSEIKGGPDTILFAV